MAMSEMSRFPTSNPTQGRRQSLCSGGASKEKKPAPHALDRGRAAFRSAGLAPHSASDTRKNQTAARTPARSNHSHPVRPLPTSNRTNKPKQTTTARGSTTSPAKVRLSTLTLPSGPVGTRHRRGRGELSIDQLTSCDIQLPLPPYLPPCRAVSVHALAHVAHVRAPLLRCSAGPRSRPSAGTSKWLAR